MKNCGAILFALASAAVIFGFKGTAVAAASLADMSFFLLTGLILLGILVSSKFFYKKHRVKLFNHFASNQQNKNEMNRPTGQCGANRKYLIGQVVYDKVRPGQTLIIKRIASSLYYCQPAESCKNRLLAYFERDLMATEF